MIGAMGKAGSPILREALLAAAVGAVVSAVLVWLGPPRTDVAAHLYQRTLFMERWKRAFSIDTRLCACGLR